jgi:hypothetical protein
VLIWCPEGVLGEHPHNGIPFILLAEALRTAASRHAPRINGDWLPIIWNRDGDDQQPALLWTSLD